MDALVGRGAEAVCKVQEGLGDAAGNVGEHEIREGLVGAAQALRKGAQHVLGQGGVGVEHVHEILVLEVEEGRRGNGGCGGRARARIEERELTDDLSGAQDCEQRLAAVAGRVAELHLALGHDVQAIAEIAFVEESLSATQGRMTHLLLEGHLLCIIKATEQRHLADEVSVTDHGAELLPLVPDCSGVSIWIAQWIPYVIPLTRRYRASHHYALSIR